MKTKIILFTLTAVLSTSPPNVIELKIRDIVANILGISPKKIDIAKTLTELDADSYDVAEIYQDIEDEFDFVFPENEVKADRSVKSIIGFIKKHESSQELRTQY